MGIFKTVTYIAGAIISGLAGYLYKVLQESDYAQGVAEIPKDDILGFHIIAAVIIAWLVISLVMKAVSRTIVITLLAAILLIEGAFLGLNLTGVVKEQQSLQQQLIEKGQELLDEVKDFTSG